VIFEGADPPGPPLPRPLSFSPVREWGGQLPKPTFEDGIDMPNLISLYVKQYDIILVQQRNPGMPMCRVLGILIYCSESYMLSTQTDRKRERERERERDREWEGGREGGREEGRRD